jgi:hypothetical protein
MLDLGPQQNDAPLLVSTRPPPLARQGEHPNHTQGTGSLQMQESAQEEESGKIFRLVVAHTQTHREILQARDQRVQCESPMRVLGGHTWRQQSAANPEWAQEREREGGEETWALRSKHDRSDCTCAINTAEKRPTFSSN